MPAIEELPIAEMWVGFRPGSRDDAPMLGPSGIDGLVVATGHHRNGILLTPVSAAVVSDYILDRPAAGDGAAVRAAAVRQERFACRRRNDPAQDQWRRRGGRGDDDRAAVSPPAASTRARGFSAVAVNGAVVRRASWADGAFGAGDAVEIVRPLQGG